MSKRNEVRQVIRKDSDNRLHRIRVHVKKNWLLYVLLLPVLVWYIIFCYAPMGGLILAFKDFSYRGGVFGSPWVGLENFKEMLSDRFFIRGIKNTFTLGIGGLITMMPCQIGLAVILNEVRVKRSKKFIQTAVTFPHFISWVVLAGIVKNLLSSTGVVNQIVMSIGLDPIAPLTNPDAYRGFIWISDIWKEVGWGSIIYLAAITSIDQGLYEAANIDGASRLQQVWHVTLPGIRSTVCIMLILATGQLLTNGRFDQIFNTYSSVVYETADTLDTYIFRETLSGGNMDFGYSTAISVFKSVFGLIMILISNKIVTAAGEEGLL